MLDDGADDVDLEIVVPGKAKSSFRKQGRQAHVLQVFRDFRVVEGQDISRERVIEIGDSTVALDFEAAGGDLLWRARLAAKNIPHKY